MTTLMLGIDGGTFDVLDGLAADGVMPCLAGALRTGARARLASTVNWLTPQAWTTVATGRSPGNHGVFDFVRAEERPDGFYFTLTDARDVACETIWATAERHGRRSAALNLPVMFPPQGDDGLVVPGFVPWRHLRRYTRPSGAFDRLRALPGFDLHRLGMDLDLERHTVQGLDRDEMAAWIRHHIERERQWSLVLDHVLRRESPDLVGINFDGNDKLLHLFWRLVAGPVDDLAPWERPLRELCLTYYRELDGHLARAVEAAGPEACVFVVSDHGFGPSDEVVYLNAWLARRGHLVWGERAPRDDVGALTVDRLRHHVEMVDWGRTRAYVLTPSSNGIRIRVAAHAGDPGVPPEEYAAFRGRLADELRELRHPEDGARVITRVRTREEAYPGDRSHLAPDLLVTLRDGGFVSILNSDCDVRTRPEVVGTHREHGIFLATGPGIEPGVRLPDQRIVDLAPTLLHSLGVPIPGDYEGTVVRGLFRDEPAPARAPVPVVAGAPAAGSRDPVYSREEEAEILGRLESLGYL